MSDRSDQSHAWQGMSRLGGLSLLNVSTPANAPPKPMPRCAPHAAPAFGNPAHGAAGLPARQSPERITAETEGAFHLRFLAPCTAPDAQMTTVGEEVHLVEVTTGSAAALTPVHGRWEVREGGPVRLLSPAEPVG